MRDREGRDCVQIFDANWQQQKGWNGPKKQIRKYFSPNFKRWSLSNKTSDTMIATDFSEWDFRYEPGCPCSLFSWNLWVPKHFCGFPILFHFKPNSHLGVLPNGQCNELKEQKNCLQSPMFELCEVHQILSQWNSSRFFVRISDKPSFRWTFFFQ